MATRTSLLIAVPQKRWFSDSILSCRNEHGFGADCCGCGAGRNLLAAVSGQVRAPKPASAMRVGLEVPKGPCRRRWSAGHCRCDSRAPGSLRPCPRDTVVVASGTDSGTPARCNTGHRLANRLTDRRRPRVSGVGASTLGSDLNGQERQTGLQLRSRSGEYWCDALKPYRWVEAPSNRLKYSLPLSDVAELA